MNENEAMTLHSESGETGIESALRENVAETQATQAGETPQADWYKLVSLEDAEAFIRAGLQAAARNVIAIGYYLKHIRDQELYREAGYKDIWEYAGDRYGFSVSTASRYMSRNDKFSQGGNSPVMDERYREYSKSQLQEMLSLNEEQLQQVTPDMTVKQIRELKHPEPKPTPYYEIEGQLDLINDFPEVLPVPMQSEPIQQLPQEFSMDVSELLGEEAEETEKEVSPEMKWRETENVCEERKSYCDALAGKLIETYHDWMLEDFMNRVTLVDKSELEFKKQFRKTGGTWYFTGLGDGGVSHANLFDDYIQFWSGRTGEWVGNCKWFYLCASVQSMWNVIALERAQQKTVATSQKEEPGEPEPIQETIIEIDMDSCPPYDNNCARQEWGVTPDEQKRGHKECEKCWEKWKHAQEVLHGNVKWVTESTESSSAAQEEITTPVPQANADTPESMIAEDLSDVEEPEESVPVFDDDSDIYDRRILTDMIDEEENLLEQMQDYWKENQPHTYKKHRMKLEAYRIYGSVWNYLKRLEGESDGEELQHNEDAAISD